MIENKGNAKFEYLTIKDLLIGKTGNINEQVKIFPIVNDTTEDDFSMIIITCSAFS